jgi:hypothetical protein
VGSYAEILIAFAMVGLLGLILRFTFSRELPRGSDDPALASHDDGTLDLDDGSYTVVSEDPAPTPAADDFGLLAPVAITDDEAAAARLKARLGEARIRATTTKGSDGRYRVLVFSTEVDRARRVGGTT